MNTPTPETDAAIADGYTFNHEDLRPVIAFCQRLERERDEARDQLARICKDGFGNDDTIGLEPADDYVLRQVAKMREVIKKVFNSFADDPYSDSAWMLNDVQIAAISKLQPFIND